MSGVIEPLYRWIGDRSPRERAMLGVCLVLTLLTAGWLLVYRPVHVWRLASEDQRQAAVTREAAVAVAARRLSAGRAPAFEGDLEGVARQRAEAAGLSVVFGMSEGGDLSFMAERAPVGTVMAWLSGLEQAGVRVTALSVVENADTTITAEGALARGDAASRGR
ncbi:type II secretion system protein GspM [Brevundimonas sp. VNH65]|uniref:type II secretion system protein GspM n=1 Tax=Brevundimonas sp. VNH65 TaxID=3400917 RepID=UPI003BFE880B